MSESTMTINPRVARADSRQDDVRLTPDSDAWSFVSERAPRYVPLFVPRGQTYYWTREWQNGEKEADEELRRGEARVFDGVTHALRWLDDPED